jgi:peptidoglycan/LPS O-acetylase OafA/YrhL
MKDGDPRHRIAYVDGLRAIAVLSVIVFHTAKYSGMSPEGPLAKFFRSGSHGVDLFFVLSGFCLSYPTLAKLQAGGASGFDVARFAARRIVRILPPYYIAITTFIICALVLYRLGLTLPKPMPQGGFTIIDVIQQALFLDHQNVKFLNGSFWTLPIEFRWYFLFPVLLWIWTRSPRGFAYLGIAVIILIATRAESIDLFVLPAFMLGIVAAALRVEKISLGHWPIVAFIALTASAYATMANTRWDYDFNMLWYLSAFSFVVVAGSNASLSALLAVPGLTAVGLASYSIYLVHEPVIAFAESYSINPYIAAAVGVVAGFLFWLVAERPFVETWIRARLLARLDPVFAHCLRRVGISGTIRSTNGARPELFGHLTLLNEGVPIPAVSSIGAERGEDNG